MKLLEDKYFDENESLNLGNSISNDFNLLLDDIRDEIGSIFTFYNDLILKGNDDLILNKTQSFLNSINERNTHMHILWILYIYQSIPILKVI